MKEYVIDDRLNSEFLVHRSVFTEQEVLEKEKRRYSVNVGYLLDMSPKCQTKVIFIEKK